MAIQITIQKSSVPIIWLDTSIILHMTQWKHKIGKLDQTTEDRVSRLFNQIYDSTRSGKLICPLAEQESEIWVEREKWLDTIHSLNMGIVTTAMQGIHDKQFYDFMKAYAQQRNTVDITYRDAFISDPVETLKKALAKPFYVNLNTSLLFGKDVVKGTRESLRDKQNEQRKRNVAAGKKFEEQLEEEYMGELDALLTMTEQCFSGQFKDIQEQMNASFGYLTFVQQLKMWEECSGKANNFGGLNQFYKSQHYRAMPLTDVSCNIIAKLMVDKQEIRSGDNMDIHHVSTLMPYSDMFITDKAMSTFLKKRNFDEKYNTKICYIGDKQDIDSFFASL